MWVSRGNLKSENRGRHQRVPFSGKHSEVTRGATGVAIMAHSEKNNPNGRTTLPHTVGKSLAYVGQIGYRSPLR